MASIRILNTDNSQYNITTTQIILECVVNDGPTLCVGMVELGDGVADLDGTGGDFELTAQVGDQVVQPAPQIITFSTATRCVVSTTAFPVSNGDIVILKIKSPNIADVNVDITAVLMDVSPIQPTIKGRTINTDLGGVVRSLKPNASNVYYVSEAGDNANDGLSWATAKRNITNAVDLVISENNDYIFVGLGHYDEDVDVRGLVINKCDLHIVGLGNTTLITNSCVGATSTVFINAYNVNMSNFNLEEDIDGVYINEDYCTIRNFRIECTSSTCIKCNSRTYATIEDNILVDSAVGVEISGQFNSLKRNTILGMADKGISIISDKNIVSNVIVDGSNGTTDIGIYVTGDNNTISNTAVGECITSFQDLGTNSWVGNQVESLLLEGQSIQQDLKDIYDDTDSIKSTVDTNLNQSLSNTESNIRGADNDDLKNISDEIIATSAPSVDEINVKLSDEHGNGAWTAEASGTIEHTIRVDRSGIPLDGAKVWITTDQVGENIVVSGFTNANGYVVFYMDAGSYWQWCEYGGVDFTNPTRITVL